MLSKALCCYISYPFTQLLTTSLFTQVPPTCNCDHVTQTLSLDTLLKYKIGAIIAILVASAGGVAIPIVGKNFPILHPESKLFFLIKSFAAGVILSTGFVHILPDAFEDLSNHRLEHTPWGKFPFTGLAAMLGALGSLMIDAVATGHYRRAHFSASADEEASGEHAGHVHLHTHATHGHAHGPGTTDAVLDGLSDFDRIRYKITSQVLEMGIIVHSVIIGISLGTSQSLDTIKPLIIALCFHQFFEGIGLGGCIAQAAFKSGSTICMALFFSLTTPVGVAIGIGVTNVYDKHSPTALIVQGLLNSMAAGILIYMALVDLLAQDFMNSKVSSRQKETSSTSGMRESVETSLLLKHRAQEIVPKRILQMEEAIETKDFPSFARLACADSNQFHAVCLDTTPPIFYMNDTSHKIISIVEKWNRAETTPQVAYTFDAGPNAVVIARDRKAASQLLQRMLLYFPPSAGADLNSYVLGDKSILQDAGIKEMKDVESLPLPPELKDANSIQKYAGDVSYFICTKPGQGPVLLSDESQALLNPETGLPK